MQHLDWNRRRDFLGDHSAPDDLPMPSKTKLVQAATRVTTANIAPVLVDCSYSKAHCRVAIAIQLAQTLPIWEPARLRLVIQDPPLKTLQNRLTVGRIRSHGIVEIRAR